MVRFLRKLFQTAFASIFRHSILLFNILFKIELKIKDQLSKIFQEKENSTSTKGKLNIAQEEIKNKDKENNILDLKNKKIIIELSEKDKEISELQKQINVQPSESECVYTDIVYINKEEVQKITKPLVKKTQIDIDFENKMKLLNIKY